MGPTEGYQLSPRASIFRRDAPKVTGLADMKMFMRLNRWNKKPADPLFPTPDAAIAARGDLMPAPKTFLDHGPRPGGAIDCKIVSSTMVKAMVVSAVSGPTNDDQPAFSWLNQMGNNSNYPHFGQPSVFKFSWQNFSAIEGLPWPQDDFAGPGGKGGGRQHTYVVRRPMAPLQRHSLVLHDAKPRQLL